MIEIIHSATAAHIETTRRLFREYNAYLGVDLDFQGFDDELKSLPGKYAPPAGSLLLAIQGGETVGCVALRKLEEGVCEMKRLYVVPAYRGRGAGRILAEAIMREARRIGYAIMRLDTLDTLCEAMRLYESLGFKKRSSYYHNPLDGAVYWEISLL